MYNILCSISRSINSIDKNLFEAITITVVNCNGALNVVYYIIFLHLHIIYVPIYIYIIYIHERYLHLCYLINDSSEFNDLKKITYMKSVF